MNLSVASQKANSESGFSSATSPAQSSLRAVSVVIIVLLWGATYVAGMFTPALLDDADSVHAEAAREMVLGHDWVTLHINNGVRYLEKAPLMYWTVAVSYRLFGIAGCSTRLTIVMGVLAMLLATYSLGRRAYGERGGFYSAIALGTALGPYLFTRFLIPDTLVSLWLTLSFLFFWRSLEEDRPSRWTCWGLAASCALNVLTKGLIGAVDNNLTGSDGPYPAVTTVGLRNLTGVVIGRFVTLWATTSTSCTTARPALTCPMPYTSAGPSLRPATAGTRNPCESSVSLRTSGWRSGSTCLYSWPRRQMAPI